MLEVNLIINAYDSSASVPDGLLMDWFNKIVEEDKRSNSTIVKNVVISGYVQLMLLIAKDYKKEIKIHSITEINQLGNIEKQHFRINGNFIVDEIKSLSVIEDILWTML